MEAAALDERSSRWKVRTDDGAELSAQFLIMATGCLSTPMTPQIEGMEDFSGSIYHTGRWLHEGVDFRGKRVCIIGTGSSAVQSIPVITKEAEQLIVFQRTAQYAVPARNRPVNPEEVAVIKADYAGFRARNRPQLAAQLSHIPRNDFSALSVDPEERERIYEERWQFGGFPFYGSFNDIGLNPESNETAAEFVRGKIRSIVQDPEVVEMLCPTLHHWL